MKEYKRIIFVSTGRCGTKRIAELLSQYLPPGCTVIHQTKYSRLSNIVGNLIYYFPVLSFLGDILYGKIISSTCKLNENFISVDPLSAMIIPESIVKSDKTYIVHLIRSQDQFASSMVRLSRKKINSFIAHNFIPLWQPHLFPLENILRRNIIDKYQFIHSAKNRYFRDKYNKNNHYTQIAMEDIFRQNTLSSIVSACLRIHVHIPPDELRKKSNESK